MANKRREYRYIGLVNDIHVWEITDPAEEEKSYLYRLKEEESARAAAYEKLKSLGFTDREMATFTNFEFTKGTSNFVVAVPDLNSLVNSIQ